MIYSKRVHFNFSYFLTFKNLLDAFTLIQDDLLFFNHEEEHENFFVVKGSFNI